MYNEESVVPHLRSALSEFMSELHCDSEVILVNDGSSDLTLPLLLEWAQQDPRIKVINLSRNFGHQIASTAALDYATGAAVVLLDADLQDPLHVIHAMIERYREGYDVVYGQRQARRGETFFKRSTAWLFYRFMRTFVHKNLPVDAGDFRLLSRPCLDGLQQMRETHRFLRGMVAWVGFPQIGVTYERSARVAGSTKYTTRKMLQFAWTAATSFSILPLKASTVLGVIVTLMGLEEATRAVLAKLFHWYTIPGWSSLTVLISILGGATLMSIGVLGEYVGKLYEQSKNRPLYLVSQTVNIQTKSGAESPYATVHKH
jgi:polyisoprenyl-phosphate glycosyltransferase